MNRALESAKRHKEEHTIQVAKQKKKKREEKGADAKDAKSKTEAYKSQGRFGKSNGLSSGKGSGSQKDPRGGRSQRKEAGGNRDSGESTSWSSISGRGFTAWRRL